MTKYHAVLLDETNQEFGVDVTAEDKIEAQDRLTDMYPESRVIQLESPEDIAEREQAMHAHISVGGDYDDEGRPFFHN